MFKICGICQSLVNILADDKKSVLIIEIDWSMKNITP